MTPQQPCYWRCRIHVFFHESFNQLHSASVANYRNANISFCFIWIIQFVTGKVNMSNRSTQDAVESCVCHWLYGSTLPYWTLWEPGVKEINHRFSFTWHSLAENVTDSNNVVISVIMICGVLNYMHVHLSKLMLYLWLWYAEFWITCIFIYQNWCRIQKTYYILIVGNVINVSFGLWQDFDGFLDS